MMKMTMVLEPQAGQSGQLTTSQDEMIAVRQYGNPTHREKDEATGMLTLIWENVSKQTAGMVTEWAWTRPNVKSLAFDKG